MSFFFRDKRLVKKRSTWSFVIDANSKLLQQVLSNVTPSAVAEMLNELVGTLQTATLKNSLQTQ